MLICQKSNIEGIKIVNKFIAVDRKQAVANRAKVIVEGDSPKILTNGQILGTATLFQNDVKLVFQKLKEQEELNSKFESSPSCAILQVQHKQKRPLKTMGASRLYAQGSNPVLVKLDQYESTRITSKFAKAFIQFSPEFNNIIDQNSKVLKILKLTEEESIVKVVWKKNVPYAFVDIKIPQVSNKMQGKIDFCDIVQNYELGSFAPLEFGEPQETNKISMSICVDFEEKNCMVEGHPKLIKVYLKFKDAEIDKNKVLEEYFSIQKIWHPRIDILSVVFKPLPAKHLAPQKTATNDMKATLVVISKDNAPVLLNAREVLADCQSIDPNENLLKFSVCGKKVNASMPVVMNQMMNEEMDQMEMEMMDDHSNPFYPMGRMNENPGFGQGQGRRGMMSMRDNFMDGGNRRMMGGNMMNRNRSMGADMDYMEYTDDLQDMAVAMDNKFKRGVSMSPMGGMRGRGGVHSRLGQRGGSARASFPPPPALGGRGEAANPLFDNLYQPQFKSKNNEQRNNLFEKARSKLNSGGPKGKTEPMMGPPRKTWSN